MPKIPFDKLRRLTRLKSIKPDVYDFGPEYGDFQKALKDTMDYFKGMSPKEINKGCCGEFADGIVQRVGGKMMETPFDSPLPNHAWVFYKGKHYDAETLHGVKNWHDLPFFKRYLDGQK